MRLEVSVGMKSGGLCKVLMLLGKGFELCQ